MNASIRMLIGKQRLCKRVKPSAMDTAREFIASLKSDIHLEQYWPQIESLLHEMKPLEEMQVESLT